MKRNPGYLLKKFSDGYFLLPFGQLISDRRRALSLSSTGAFVWELLEKDMSRGELLSAYTEKYLDGGASPEELGADLAAFLDDAVSLGILSDDPRAEYAPPVSAHYLSIGGLTVLLDCPEYLISRSGLRDFISEPQPPDLAVTAEQGNPEAEGEAVLNDPELSVYKSGGEYILKFPTLSAIGGARLSEFGDRARVYLRPETEEALAEQFFHVLRHIFLYLAQRRGMYAIHSVSVNYDGRALLFSASSGTGKSTHAAIWKKLFGVETVNGDLNLIAISGGRATVRGIPWCGTSGIAGRGDIPLGGIAFLRRGEFDVCEELSAEEKALSTLRRLISPMWTKTQLAECADFSERLAGLVPMCRLRCTVRDSSALALKEWADRQK